MGGRVSLALIRRPAPPEDLFVCVCVCVCVCMHVCMRVFVYVCMHVCMSERMQTYVHGVLLISETTDGFHDGIVTSPCVPSP